MTRISVSHSLDGLVRDCLTIEKRAPRDLQKVVNEGAKVGNTLARNNARRSAGAHGRHYPRSFSWEKRPAGGAFGYATYSAIYGPDAAKRQGNMSFEYGSRNQKPHLDLARSADVVGPALAGEVRSLVGSLFWPGGAR